MNKKILEISESEYVSLFLNNLIIKQKEEKIIIPINNIEVIIFENERTNISIPVINELVDKKVNIIICKNHLPNSIIVPHNGYYDNKVFQNQIKWDIKYKSLIWQKIIKLKIENSLYNLTSLDLINDIDIQKINNYILNVEDYDKTNREGHAAKLYFQILFGSDFTRERNAEDKINIYLNYGYSVLLSLIARLICSKGLDNRISLFHKSFNNNFPLACDLMEPFRFWIDRIVFDFYKENFEKTFQEFKETLFKSFNKYIVYKNKTIKFSRYIDIVINELLNLEESETEID
ncbi:type II CRISPR-associated endonuclease Cas1 [Mycoplasmopsis arginini]|uniref:CRISPR-associated endonuclease Cas1 n=1 Tax=Mycoplasmopsis arginini TaxID=2094 RepID=A0AA43TZG9_MYCAR|nr:type II CRISPR-associated endonuclease Cas1 [Mycoplasmopsis arginini]ENY70070.1 Hypothetical protein, predicted CRISPR associated protein Cas1 [Mycoplasmopsis arginini 7264]MDI3349360.1 type II CRISPR-associated endonuclease Cas1 [Mycoplasmopsis arginini]